MPIGEGGELLDSSITESRTGSCLQLQRFRAMQSHSEQTVNAAHSTIPWPIVSGTVRMNFAVVDVDDDVSLVLVYSPRDNDDPMTDFCLSRSMLAVGPDRPHLYIS